MLVNGATGVRKDYLKPAALMHTHERPRHSSRPCPRTHGIPPHSRRHPGPCSSGRCPNLFKAKHISDVILNVMASKAISLTIVYSTVYSGADQRKHQSSASLAFVRGIHRWPVNSPHKGPVTHGGRPIKQSAADGDMFSTSVLGQMKQEVTCVTLSINGWERPYVTCRATIFFECYTKFV